jgi:chloramphenicol 3-O-phosphotransferase
MRLIFLYGMPATGKLTVAQELKALSGFQLFHNHLAVDLLLSTFEFGSEPFVVLREQIWLSVFEQAIRAGLPGLIFTFAPEATVRDSFLPETLRIVQGAGGTVDFVALTCPPDEIRRRLARPSRQRFGKLTSVDLFDQLLAARTFDRPQMPEPKISVDTSVSTPARAALEIARALGIVPAAKAIP